MGGTFSGPQRDLYETVLEVQVGLLDACVHGTTLDSLHRVSLELMSRGLERLGFDLGAGTGGVAAFYPHSVGHYLGIDTHDTPGVPRSTPLDDGMVVTIEPGAYVPALDAPGGAGAPKHYRGIGIRIEDDVAFLSGGRVENLTVNIPKTVEEVEAACNASRMTSGAGVDAPRSSSHPTPPEIVAERFDVALVTTSDKPEEDPDEDLLLATLLDAGINARVVAWDDPATDWRAPRLAVLRSTWDYPWRLGEWRRWLAVADASTAVLNPASMMQWNSDKRYMMDLAADGVPTVDTAYLWRGASEVDLATLGVARGWGDVVVKPAIGAGSYRAVRTRVDDPAGQAHLEGLLRDGDALVQPFVAAVEAEGEHAVVLIDDGSGSLVATHAVRKSPRFEGDDEAVSEAVPVTTEQQALAQAAIASAMSAVGAVGGRGSGSNPLYARVDMVPDQGVSQGWRVMELELVEPSLFLKQSPAALHAFARAIGGRLHL